MPNDMQTHIKFLELAPKMIGCAVTVQENTDLAYNKAVSGCVGIEPDEAALKYESKWERSAFFNANRQPLYKEKNPHPISNPENPWL